MKNNIRFLILQEILKLTSTKLLKESLGEVLLNLLRSEIKIGGKLFREVADSAFRKSYKAAAAAAVLTEEESSTLVRAFEAAGLEARLVVRSPTSASAQAIRDAISKRIYGDAFDVISGERRAVLESAMSAGLEEVAKLMKQADEGMVRGAVKAAVTSSEVLRLAEAFATENAPLLKAGKKFTDEEINSLARRIIRELYEKEIPDALLAEIRSEVKIIIERVLKNQDFLARIDAIPKTVGFYKIFAERFSASFAPKMGERVASAVAFTIACAFYGALALAGFNIVYNVVCSKLPIVCNSGDQSQGSQSQGSQSQGSQSQGSQSSGRGPKRLKGRSAGGGGGGTNQNKGGTGSDADK